MSVRASDSGPRGSRVEVTVVLPAHNEEGNVAPLLEQFGELSRRARFTLEVVLVDDGSTDQTLPRAVEAQKSHRYLRIVSLPYRRGLTEALRAGFAAAKGDILVFYPADRQFHPSDIPRMVEKVRAGFDLVTGRKIGQYSKRFVSGYYNRLSRLLFRSIQVSDLNSVKAFRRELIDVFDYRHDWHRFWVAIVSESGYRVGEVDVTLYDRPSGKSKFGLWRIPGAVLDLLAVKFQYHTMRRPLWYFGLSGMAMLTAGFLLGLLALYQRFIEGSGNRALLFLVMTLGLSGVVLFAIGFLAESVAAIRQQVETLRTRPKYQIFKPGPPSRSSRPTASPRTPREARSRSGRDRGRRTTDRPHESSQRRQAPAKSPAKSTGPGKQVTPRPLKSEGSAAEKPMDEKPAEEKSSRGQESLEFPAASGGFTTSRKPEATTESSAPPARDPAPSRAPEQPRSGTPPASPEGDPAGPAKADESKDRVPQYGRRRRR